MKESSLFFKFVVSVIRLFIKFKSKEIVSGLENIPKTGACIVIATHMHPYDAVIATEFCTRAGRAPRIMAKASLWKLPVVKQAFESGKLIPVERGTNNASTALKEAKKRIEDNDLVFIFPEGTTTKDPQSWPMSCKTGAARLALMTGVPVIPILQDGAQFLNKDADTSVLWYKEHVKKGLFGKKIVMHIKAYPPLDLSQYVNPDDYKDNNYIDEEKLDAQKIIDVNQVIEDKLTQMAEENRGVKAPKRFQYGK